jgi:plastocyanin
VRRSVAGFAVAALAGAAIVLVGPGWDPSQGGDARAADCAWQSHSKRVVKHVKRRGKVRKVRRIKRWWTCDAIPAPAPLGIATPPAPAAPNPPPPPESDSTVARLGIKADEYSYTLSRPSIAPGDVIVELNNQGEDFHNLNLQLADGEGASFEIPETAPLAQGVERFTLPAGEYRLWCSLPEHEELGMQATLLVGDG